MPCMVKKKKNFQRKLGLLEATQNGFEIGNLI
jgi:hypothetical protein